MHQGLLTALDLLVDVISNVSEVQSRSIAEELEVSLQNPAVTGYLDIGHYLKADPLHVLLFDLLHASLEMHALFGLQHHRLDFAVAQHCPDLGVL